MPTTSHAKSRPDQDGAEAGIYRKNKKILLKTAEVCAICGGYIDKSLRFPNPMSASVDHIIPVSKGGRSTMDNLQVTHLVCNMSKGANIQGKPAPRKKEQRMNIPQYFDWSQF